MFTFTLRLPKVVVYQRVQTINHNPTCFSLFFSLFIYFCIALQMDTTLLGLDPLFLTNVKLIIHDLLNLEKANEDMIGMYVDFINMF